MLYFKTLLRYEPAVFLISLSLLMGIAFSCHREPEVVPVEIRPLDPLIGTHSGKCRYQHTDPYYGHDTLISTMIDTTYGNSLITIQRINDRQIRIEGCGWNDYHAFTYPLDSTQTNLEGFWVQGSRLSTITIDLIDKTITTTERYDPVSTVSFKWEGQWRF